MAQLNLYIPEALMNKITSAAKKKKVSISSWVKDQLEGKLYDAWPNDYFNLFGSLKDLDFERAEQSPFSSDIKREAL